MRLEVHSAADFLMNLLRVKSSNPLSETQLQHFKGSLEEVLIRKFRSHWYPEVPTKGSGFRCIRINGKMDPIIEKAGVAVGLNSIVLRKMLPQELTMWIDPDEVSYRIGENGSICVIYDPAQSRSSPSSDLDSTGSSDEFIMERVGRIDLSQESTLAFVEFLENQNSLVVASSPAKQHRYHHSKRHNNSVSSTSSGQMSPPLSPQYNNQHQQHVVHQQQRGNFFMPANRPEKTAVLQMPHQFYPSQPQPYFWDNQFVNNKVRTQC
jgi:protein Tob/BTG